MKTLLIVDDDRCLVDSLCVVFAGLYEIRMALSADEARTVLENDTVDVMLLDVILPGITGIEFLKELRETKPDLPVVMISGAASIRPVLEALELGADDYVRKPFDIDELRLVTARALRTRELEKEVTVLQDELARRPVIAEPGQKPMKEAVEEFERTLISKALKNTGGIQTHAARMLGTTRRILRYRIEKLGLDETE